MQNIEINENIFINNLQGYANLIKIFNLSIMIMLLGLEELCKIKKSKKSSRKDFQHNVINLLNLFCRISNQTTDQIFL